jgi:hypothetical protein
MDEKQAIFTAARRYCLEHAPGLNPQHEEQWYQEAGGSARIENSC